MKKISRWAKHNKWKARFCLVILNLLIAVTGLSTGLLLSGLNLQIPSFIAVSSIILFLSMAVIYPYPHQKSTANAARYYVNQKTCDFLLACISYILFVVGGNYLVRDELNIMNTKAFASINTKLPGDSSVHSYKIIKEFSQSLKDKNGKTLKWKERKKLLKQQLKGIRQSYDMPLGVKILLTVLCSALATFLLYLVAALACELSCAGVGTGAWLVGIGGTALVIFLLILAFRGIYGRKKKKMKKESNSQL